MVYRSVRPRPPRGSTAWGAQQFLRVLDEEERIAAEREQLLATGWQPPSSSSWRAPQTRVFDEHSYADLIERGLASRRALEQEARLRALGLAEPRDVEGTIRSGRHGVPMTEHPNGGADSRSYVQPVNFTDRADASGPNLRQRPQYPQVATAAALPEVLAWLAGLGAAGAAVQATKPGGQGGDAPHSRDFGWSLEDLLPPHISPPPQSGDPEGREDFSKPLPGYADQTDELRQFGRPSDPLPLPEDAARPPQQPPLSQLRPEPLVRISLQEIVDRFFDAGILIRRENASTRQDNEDIIQMVKDTMLSCGWNPEKIYGTSEIERRLENEEFPGTRGDRWLDGSVKGTAPDGRTALYDFNTAQRLVDGRWVAYERRAENAIRLLKDVVDKGLRTRFDVYPKSRGMDRETWRESVRPYVEEAVRALLDC